MDMKRNNSRHTAAAETMTESFSEVCPVCGGKKYIALWVSSVDGYTTLIANDHGSTILWACTNCGTVRLPGYFVNRLKER